MHQVKQKFSIRLVTFLEDYSYSNLPWLLHKQRGTGNIEKESAGTRMAKVHGLIHTLTLTAPQAVRQAVHPRFTTFDRWSKPSSEEHTQCT